MRSRSFRPHVEQMESRLVPSVVNVHAGDDLQAALNGAQLGDRLVLDAGATFTGPVTLPNKAGDQWITLQSSALDRLPGDGQRVGPEHAPLMPKIVSPGLGQAALQTSPGAHHYRFLGVEFLPATPDAFVYDLITLGNGEQTTLEQVPHDLTLDRCYVHTWLDQSLKRGIALNSAATDITNSYIAGFKVDGQDSQAINGWNGPGPFRIVNNYLEAAGENIQFGGAYATIPGLVPSDIEFRGNLVSKPLAWNANDAAAYQGKHWTVKNLFELKNARRVTIDGNRFENNWVDAQTGFAILFTPRGEQSGGRWAVVRDVTFTDNVVTHTAQGVGILGSDSYSPSRVTENVLIQNNLFDDVGTGRWGDPGNSPRLFQLDSGLAGGTRSVIIDHNTATSGGTVIMAIGVHTGFAFTNNVAPHGTYGVMANSVGEGTVALESAFPGYTFRGNVIIGAAPEAYPPDNLYGATSNERFVMQVYLDLLQRPVDPTGLATWTAALAQGASRAQVAQAIEASPEFRTAQVRNLYTMFLHRAADPSGLKNFTDFLANGGTVEQVAASLAGSQEYFLTQGRGTNGGFLDALYRDALNRAVDASGRAKFDKALAGGAPRAQVVTAIFTSTEFRQALVGSFYQRFLRRAADGGSLNVFVDFLRRGGRDEQLIAALVSSAEYSARL